MCARRKSVSVVCVYAREKECECGVCVCESVVCVVWCGGVVVVVVVV